MVFSREIGLITIMVNILIKLNKSSSKFEAILLQEELLSMHGMLPIYPMRAFPLRKMSNWEKCHWHHATRYFNFLFPKENFHVSFIREAVTHS